MIPSSQPSPSDSAIDGLLAVTDQSGRPLIKDRIGNVKNALAVYQSMVNGDWFSRLNRVKMQMKLDGVPPYDPQQLISRGLASIANVNFGFMSDALELALAPYLDLIDSSEALFRCPVLYGDDPQQRMDWQNTIELEITRLITQGDGFDYDFNSLCHQFIFHGVSIPYFENTKDFEWTTGTIADFLIPRHTRAKESKIEVSCAEQYYLPHELFEKIENPESAEEAGWNVKETWKIIKTAQQQVQYQDNPERLEEDYKDNDLTWSARSKEIRVVHMWTRGLDGSGSHYMFDADGKCEDYMYKKIGKFKSMSEAFTMFTYGIGTNEFYHGIRGLGFKLFALIKEMDELWSAFLDAMRMNGKLLLKANNAADLKKLALVQFGHYIVPPPNTEVTPLAMPDLTRSMMPGIGLFSGMLQQKAASYTAPDQFNQKQRGRLKEIAARMEEVAHLSVSKMNTFYKSFERLGREQIRRIIRKDWLPTDPNYSRIKVFQDRCKRQGVPLEAIYSIDLKGVEAIRAVGAGSRAARKIIMEELKDPISQCDEEGKYQFVRDQIRFIAGPEAANRYAPRKRGLRPPQDKAFADIENSIMAMGQPPAFEPNQLHAVHVTQHLEKIEELIKESEEMVQQGVQDIRAFQGAPVMREIFDHIEKQHMPMIPEQMPDGTPNEQRAELNQAVQQTGEAVNNNGKHYDKLLKEQQAQQAKAQGQPPEGQRPQVDNATIAQDKQAIAAIELQRKQFELNADQEKHQQEMQQKKEKHEQEMQHAAEQRLEDKARLDAQTAAEVARKALTP